MKWWRRWQLRQLAVGDVFLLQTGQQYQLWRLQRQSASGLSLCQLGGDLPQPPTAAELAKLCQSEDMEKRRGHWLLTQDEFLSLAPKRIRRA